MDFACEVLDNLFALLYTHGVREIVASPGSRNASLLSYAVKTGLFKKVHTVVDERAGAFIGLGIAVVSRRPVALVCTSGSAVLNYSPAVAEAFYQGVPLIVISADRPEEWIDQDDSQTIRQPGILSHIVKDSYDINAVGNNRDEDYIWYVNRMINEGLVKAKSRKKGPVHFNIHLDGKPHNPLSGEIRGIRDIYIDSPVPRFTPAEIRDHTDHFRTFKIMVVAGQMAPDHRMQKAMAAMAELPNVCVMAETVSNLHLSPECYMVDTVLFPMDEKKARSLAPELVLSVGGALISRKLKEYIRNYPPRVHWSLGFSDNIIDCFKSLNAKLEVDPASFLHSFAKRMEMELKRKPVSSLYRSSWTKQRLASIKPTDNLPWCDLKALSIVLNGMPGEANLFLSNGTSVRYDQIIPHKPPHATYANRGVSGIEGCTSTAIGCAVSSKRITCLITGDMSFGYDLGALASRLAPANLRIIVLDNEGGDIFRFIQATKNLSIREKYLCADTRPPIRALAEAFGFEYYFADREKILYDNLEDFFRHGDAPKILHLSTRGCANSEILTKFLKNHELD